MPRDQRAYNAAYYARHREHEIERVASRQRATLEWLRHLRRVPCMDCGGTFPPHVMDFDHRDPSTKAFSLAGQNNYLKNRQVIEAEVAKCDIVCGNCHRTRTERQYANGELTLLGFKRPSVLRSGPRAATRRERSRLRRKQQMDLLIRLRRLPCAECGGRFPVCAMEFDHREIWSKVGLVSQMAGRVGIGTLLEEIAKCDIVCTNCHRDRSFRRRFPTAGVAQWLMRLASNQDKRVRFPSPAQLLDELPRVFEEAPTPYRFAT